MRVAEGIAELRVKCQKPRQAIDTWQGRNIARPVSIYLTRALLQAGCSANGATLIFLLLGLGAVALLSAGTGPAILGGCFLLQFWYLFDHVDGEIARYRGTSSLTGVYFDLLIHYVVHPAAFACAGIGLFRKFQYPWILAWAGLAAFGSIMVMLVPHLRYVVIAGPAVGAGGAGAVPKAGARASAAGGKGTRGPSETPTARTVFAWLHKLSTFPSAMNLLTLAALLEVFVADGILAAFLAWYAVMSSFVWVLRSAVTILKGKVDQESREAVLGGMGH